MKATSLRGQKEIAIKASKLIKIVDGVVYVSEAALDDIIKNAQKITEQKNFVQGSTVYNHGYASLQGFIAAARASTVALIESGEMLQDKYNLLTCKVTVFGKHNKLINRILEDLKEQELLDAQKQREENPNSAEALQPFTEEQLSNIKAEPKVDDPESHVVNETTKDGGRLSFDKINYEILVYKQDGTTVTIRLAPEGTWRRTIINWLEKFCKGVSDVVVGIGKGIAEVFSTGYSKFKGIFSKKEQLPEPPAKPALEVKGEDIVEKETESKK